MSDARTDRPRAGHGKADHGASGANQGRERPSLPPRSSAVYATIEATPEEIQAIEAIEAEARLAFDHIPDDVVGDDAVNAVLVVEQDKRDKLASVLGDRRAYWYLKLRADELEPEVLQLLAPPEDAGSPASAQAGAASSD